MSLPNTVQVQVSTNGVNWSDLYNLQTSIGGIFSDFFHYVPPGPGSYYFRALITDNNGNTIGRTSIIAMAANR